MVHGKKIIARKLAIKICALAEVAEIILREGSHERVLAILEARIGVKIWEVHTGVTIDDIDDDCDTMLVGNVNHLLEVGSLAEPFVNAEIPDGKITPVNRGGDVRERHHLDCIHT